MRDKWTIYHCAHLQMNLISALMKHILYYCILIYILIYNILQFLSLSNYERKTRPVIYLFIIYSQTLMFHAQKQLSVWIDLVFTMIKELIHNMRLSARPNPHIFGWSTVTLIGPISHLQLDKWICLWPHMMFKMLSLCIGAQKYTFWKIALDELWWI